MNNLKKEQAFTLVEVLCVIAITMATAALLYPVIARGKERAHEADSISNMRQLVTACLLYEQDYADFPVGQNVDRLVSTGYLSSPKILLSKADPFGGFVSAQALCTSKTLRHPTSYSWPFEASHVRWRELKRVDANPGIIATLVHSQRTQKFTFDPNRFCHRYPFMYDKRVLRARLDGSVKFYPFSLDPGNRPNSSHTFRFISLFTDEPNSLDGIKR